MSKGSASMLASDNSKMFEIGRYLNNKIENMFTQNMQESPNISLATKNNFTPRKDKRKGSENRQQGGSRERNVGHPEGEEHSRVAKGNRGIHRSVLVGNRDDINMNAIIGTSMVIVGGVALIYLVANDASGVVVVDDVLIAPVLAFIQKGVEQYAG